MDERQYTIAMQQLLFNFPDAAIRMYRTCGTAVAVYEHRNDIRSVIPDASDTLVRIISGDWSEALKKAEDEMAWCRSKSINILTPADSGYPRRLNTCHDAPLALYYLGSADLNNTHILSIVGTRKSTQYGHEVITTILGELKKKFPDLLIVSGLAYGIDVEAHRTAINNGMPTVGVVAHGLDTIYPAAHRSTAVKMLSNGGLLTEYVHRTPGDRQNFLRRNRIVAGMSDATLVIESKAHGGSLVTARIASDYGREVFAVPGNILCESSEGCNRLIHDNKATALLSADDIITTLGWQYQQIYDAAKVQGIQTTMFNAPTPDEQKVIDILTNEDLNINDLALKTGIPSATLSSTVFQMEMSGKIRALPGNLLHYVNA